MTPAQLSLHDIAVIALCRFGRTTVVDRQHFTSMLTHAVRRARRAGTPARWFGGSL
jgi:hypothetical protein